MARKGIEERPPSENLTNFDASTLANTLYLTSMDARIRELEKFPVNRRVTRLEERLATVSHDVEKLKKYNDKIFIWLPWALLALICSVIAKLYFMGKIVL